MKQFILLVVLVSSSLAFGRVQWRVNTEKKYTDFYSTFTEAHKAARIIRDEIKNKDLSHLKLTWCIHPRMRAAIHIMKVTTDVHYSKNSTRDKRFRGIVYTQYRCQQRDGRIQ